MKQPVPDHVFPVLPQTIKSFSDQICQSVTHHQSATFVFSHLQGGERAWIRFLFDHPNATDFFKKLTGYKLICFDPTETIDSSHAAFLYHLVTLLSPKYPDYSTLSLQQIIALAKKSLSENLAHQKVVIFMLKLNSFPNLSPALGNILYSLWRPYKRKLMFVTTVTPEQILSQFPELVGEFSEPLLENVHTINRLSSPNIIHSILHWEKILGQTVSVAQKAAVIKYAQGSPYIAKILTQNILLSPPDNPDDFCKQIVAAQFGPILTPKPLSEIPLNSFSPQETAIVRLFLTCPEKLLSRDDLATALWGGLADEKYSQWAIDKFISLIRKKLQDHNCTSTIKTVKNQGYLLQL